MGSGIVGEIFDAVDNADNSRIIICGGGIGTPQFSMRHYSAGYGIDMWLNTSSPWDTYIDNRNAASGFIFRNNCNNDGGEDELMRITGSGNVGIGTPPEAGSILHIKRTTADAKFTLETSDSYTSFINFSGGSSEYSVGFYRTDSQLRFALANNITSNVKMVLNGNGNVGIGTTSPSSKLQVHGNLSLGQPGNGSNTNGRFISLEGNTDSGGEGSARIFFAEHNSTTAAMDAYGMSLGYRGGATTITGASGNDWTGLSQIGNGQWGMWGHNNDSTGALIMYGDRAATYVNFSGNDVSGIGTLSKSSGTFNIEHPLESKAQTHRLVHSFVESPQANNIYRGRVNLIDGQASINLDTVSNMTEGTFVALNRDIHSYVSNESDWDAVRSKVEGNILTVECQNNSSTATVTWLVIGERHDTEILQSDITDENGSIIVEPLITGS